MSNGMEQERETLSRIDTLDLEMYVTTAVEDVFDTMLSMQVFQSIWPIGSPA